MLTAVVTKNGGGIADDVSPPSSSAGGTRSIDQSKQRFIKHNGPWEESSPVAYPTNWDYANGFLVGITPPLHTDTLCHQRNVPKFAGTAIGITTTIRDILRGTWTYFCTCCPTFRVS